MRLENQEYSSKEAGDGLLSREKAEELCRQVPQWILRDSSMEREFQFQDFRQAMEFVDRVAEIAEQQNHHPDIVITYNKVKLTLSTHKVGGLSRKDFHQAAEIDRMLQESKNPSVG